MQRPLQRFEDFDQGVARATFRCRRGVLGLQHRLGQLQIPVTEFVPREFVQCGSSVIESIAAERRLHVSHHPPEARANPTIGD